MDALHVVPAVPVARRKVVPDGVLGMLIFVVAELMMFAGFISAFTIVRSGAMPGMWPPPDQPRLPASATALNTAFLISSGLVLYLCGRKLRAQGSVAAARLLGLAWVLGAAFVALQGVEWVALLRQGLTLTSSTLGSFFYLVVGAHALHAVAALAALGLAWVRARRATLSHDFFFTAQVFWLFVVGLWPVIYLRVYF